MPSADAMARTTGSAASRAGEAAALRAAAARQASRNQYRGSADAIARSPTIVGQKAAASEAAAIRAAQSRMIDQNRIYESADAISASPTLVGPEAASSEIAAREAGAARLPIKPPPVYRQSGSGRQAEVISSGDGGGLAPTPSVFVPPESVTAAPAVMQPPAVVAEAPPSAVNVPGESFTTVGSPGSFGEYERRRTSRGPRTGMSVTPEMIRRAAANRLG